jgi:uncharacterized protein YjbI with pentapeptide repeats
MRYGLLALLLGGLGCYAAQAAEAAPPKLCTMCDFSAGQLASADLTGVTYIGVNFMNAVLRNASFRQARLLAVNFQGADLRGAAFDGAECIACNFLTANLDGATFSGTRIVAGNFKDLQSGVSGAALRDLLAGCVSCNFTNAHLAGSDLSQLPLISIDFTHADLRGANFSGAVLCWYAIQQSRRNVTCDVLTDANVQDASFANVQLCENPAARQGCTSVQADALRRYTNSALNGAKF